MTPQAAVTPYHTITVEKILQSYHRKVCVEDVTVTYRRRQKDADWHITVVDAKGRKLVLEIIPELPLPLPQVGRSIDACGILGYDKYHKWYELHPLVKWVTHPTDERIGR